MRVTCSISFREFKNEFFVCKNEDKFTKFYKKIVLGFTSLDFMFVVTL